jgi:hypothetical protein
MFAVALLHLPIQQSMCFEYFMILPLPELFFLFTLLFCFYNFYEKKGHTKAKRDSGSFFHFKD